MIQRQRPTPSNVRACTCGLMPRLYQVGAGLHMLECSPCGVRTHKLPSVAAAVEAWGSERTEKVTPFRAALNAQRGRR